MNRRTIFLTIFFAICLLLVTYLFYYKQKHPSIVLDNSENEDDIYIDKELGNSGFEITYPESWSIQGITENNNSNKYVDDVKVDDNFSNQISIVIRKSDLAEIEQMRIEDENTKKGIFPTEYTGYIGYQDLPKREWHDLNYYPCEIQLLEVGDLSYCRGSIEIDSYDNNYKSMIYVIKDNKVSAELETKSLTSDYDYLQITYTFSGNPFESDDYDYTQVLEEFDKAVISLLKSANSQE